MSRAELELEAGTLEPGESVRMVCPFCGGGDRAERCLSLTHREDGTLLYHCYRARCGAGGTLGANASLRRGLARVGEQLARASGRAKPNIESRLRRLDTSPVTEAWGLCATTLDMLGVRWDEETGRLAYPVYTPQLMLRGRVLRVPPGDERQPKALTHMYEDAPTLAWNTVDNDGDLVVVVEDIPSALMLDDCNYRAVALNGTHLTDEAVAELDQNATRVIWALDRDAFNKAMALDKKYRLLFKSTAVLMLDRDFKNQTWEEVDKCLYEICLGLS